MSTPQLFDVHTHTQFAAFKDDADLVIERALNAGVWMINVGTQKDTSAKAVEFANKYSEGVYAAVGLHPIHTERSYHDPQELGLIENLPNHNNAAGGFVSRGEEFDYEYYKKLAQNPRVLAIGECGLDYYRMGEDTKEKQRAAFVQQIELAYELKKPLMIHCRQAFGDLIELLNSKLQILNSLPGVVHFFSGTKNDAKKLLDLGFYFSFGGVITFTHDYDEVVKYIPLERILLETDAPYVTPVPYRGKRNEPAYIIETCLKLAELKGVRPEKVGEVTVSSAKTIFNLE
jgi:TatD DNase family protein